MELMNRFFHCGPAAVICLCLLSFLLPAETLTYHEVEGEIAVTHTIAITPAPPGYSVELASRRSGGGMVRQTFRTAADLSTLAWTFSDPGTADGTGRQAAGGGHHPLRHLSRQKSGEKILRHRRALEPALPDGAGTVRPCRGQKNSIPFHRHPGAGRDEDRQIHRHAQGR